jgi:hypothetical protein
MVAIRNSEFRVWPKLTSRSNSALSKRDHHGNAPEPVRAPDISVSALEYALGIATVGFS